MNPIEFFKSMNQFDKHLGLELFETNENIHYELLITGHHLSSPGVGHGAVVAAMMDAVIGTRALIAVYKEGNLVSTVEFKINYFQPIFLGDRLTGRGEIEFLGKSLIAVSGNIINQNGEIVSKALGTFNIYPMSKRGISL